MQDACIQSKGKSVHDVSSVESIHSKEGMEKGKGKHATTMRKGDERPTLSHCQNQGREEAKC